MFFLMAIGKNFGSNIVSTANERYGIGLVRSKSLGRKRVALSNDGMKFENDDCVVTTPSKRRCFDQDSVFPQEKSRLENLPQEILVKILCCVEHDDLKRLFSVSKAVRESALIAKQYHFAYSTPKKTVRFQSFDCFDDFNETEAPNAPKQSRAPRQRLGAKKLADISVALFASGDEESWRKRDLCAELEMGN